SEGELIAHTDNGPITYTTPIAFQQDATGNRESVSVQYALHDTESSYRFAVGTYDRSRPLIIDPLLQSTYLGAAGDDIANAIAIHPVTGHVYVAGRTSSTTNTFPATMGGYQPANGGSTDAFVSGFTPELTNGLVSTYL